MERSEGLSGDRLHMQTQSSPFVKYYLKLRGCIQKFPDWVDNEICAYNKLSL